MYRQVDSKTWSFDYNLDCPMILLLVQNKKNLDFILVLIRRSFFIRSSEK